MKTDDAPMTALERAHNAYEQMQRRASNAAMKRRARARVRNIGLAVVCGTTLMIFVGVSVYNGWMPTPLRMAADDIRASKNKAAEVPTAPVRSFVKGNTCQELKFSNESGALVAGSFVPCEPESKRSVPTLTSVQKSSRTRDGVSK